MYYTGKAQDRRRHQQRSKVKKSVFEKRVPAPSFSYYLGSFSLFCVLPSLEEEPRIQEVHFTLLITDAFFSLRRKNDCVSATFYAKDGATNDVAGLHPPLFWLLL